MKYRQLGSCDQLVSELGLHVWADNDGGVKLFDQEKRIRLLQEAFDAGITLFDTADHQGNGFAEELLAKALGQHRHEIVISTKGGSDFYNFTLETMLNGPNQNFSPPFIKYACEQSLRRLKTDYIDLYQLHNPSLGTFEEDELFDCLNLLVKEGKIRFFGTSFGANIDFAEEAELQIVKQSIMSVQMDYNIFEQEPARTVLHLAENKSVAILTSRPHSNGTLTQAFYNTLSNIPNRPLPLDTDKVSLDSLTRKIQSLAFLTDHHERTMDRLAIHFNLAHQAVSTVLVDVSTKYELDEYKSALEEDAICAHCLAQLHELYDREFEAGQEFN
ncbi:aldo/keto reductase [SAR202 cluster bacterium AD-802-E10_MRT_200m]|nr:aldo/keto reductase [SAR202 cluster bacterium AD-802-E10_MRT_200m]